MILIDKDRVTIKSDKEILREATPNKAAEKEKLNEKLAERRGFVFKVNNRGAKYWELHDIAPYAYTGKPIYFTDSLDSCFKWLVPPIIQLILQTNIWNMRSAHQYLFALWYQEICDRPDEPTIALCLAIEKLIDAEKLSTREEK